MTLSGEEYKQEQNAASVILDLWWILVKHTQSWKNLANRSILSLYGNEIVITFYLYEIWCVVTIHAIFLERHVRQPVKISVVAVLPRNEDHHKSQRREI